MLILTQLIVLEIRVIRFQCNQQLFQNIKSSINFLKTSEKYFVRKIINLDKINKELEFKMKFYEERNKELLEEIKGNRAIESNNSVKSKSDRKKFYKRCKGLEAITKTQDIEIKSLKEIIESKNKKMKSYEIEIKAFEQQIKRINNDIQEFKITNAVLSEAQQKNIEIENRQQQQKLMKLQN
jgi:hypothetical protein